MRAQDRRELAVTRPWMRDGETFVAEIVTKLSDDQLRAPSALPGWSRAHVVGHLARNAEALQRLATWARTGVETPMYPSPEHRSAAIEASAQAPAATLREELHTTAAALESALDAFDDATWRAEVRSALGRPIPAAEIPWMRVREVWLHGVDLDAGATVADLPAGVVDALLDDATDTMSAREDMLSARLEATDRDRAWTLGQGEGQVLRGSAADLLGWLLGRTDGSGVTAGPGPLPVAPRWL
ncbi:maleylpyruvate isomerase family mycothiol-dependent enzyme [Pseudonocardia asaccharolytica]|uniref:Maleylpyruvate isomerase n=1 Tax=Pseudonocardia asaccharolytica DSM 44247 = NBRC 16224 TaxID=1123024 RepID=A0A511D025_9PSEU|nr:maleylpyruvate isomerase family mycothiol-dependent enzyme [Pseudonocardia asaccharolytica]GEL18145.1 maleylpyruvate isomerase [Pseudonocardia asaccharolytica DSM 44247 = NBRC 16224]